MKKDLRRHSRAPLQVTAVIFWEGANGVRLTVRGVCRDVSDAGMLVVVPDAIPLRTLVAVEVFELGLKGTATVRHCRLGRGGYVVGLESTDGVPWQRAVR
jgi:hypothetical protein